MMRHLFLSVLLILGILESHSSWAGAPRVERPIAPTAFVPVEKATWGQPDATNIYMAVPRSELMTGITSRLGTPNPLVLPQKLVRQAVTLEQARPSQPAPQERASVHYTEDMASVVVDGIEYVTQVQNETGRPLPAGYQAPTESLAALILEKGGPPDLIHVRKVGKEVRYFAEFTSVKALIYMEPTQVVPPPLMDRVVLAESEAPER